MQISYKEFLLLVDLVEQANQMPDDDLMSIKLTEEGYLYDGQLTEKSWNYLEAHKVDNAIILAAGYGSRFEPLSHYLPKGLIKIKGEVLIERIIRQLHEKGIQDIVVVTGYMADKFSYLQDKYAIEMIHNKDYMTCNNISSIYYARDYLKNSYILGCDNWYSENIFNKYEYDSYYSRMYSHDFVDEYCVELDYDDYILSIKKGSADSWYTVGEIYFSEFLSNQIRHNLDIEYGLPEVQKMIIDIYCQRHIDIYRFHTKERKRGIIYEFDTMEEAEQFDESFPMFVKEIMDNNQQ